MAELPDAPQPLRIERATTSWVFVSDSDEPRHLWDIVFGLHVLNLKKVPKDRIHVCTSHIAAAQHLNPYGISSIYPIDQLDVLLTGLSCEMLVLVVGGHGRPDGVGQGKRVLSPAEAVTKARSIASLRAGVIILSQCFAGVFNLMDAETHPPLVLIGATNLNESLSAGVDLQNPIGRMTDRRDSRAGSRTSSHFTFSTGSCHSQTSLAELRN